MGSGYGHGGHLNLRWRTLIEKTRGLPALHSQIGTYPTAERASPDRPRQTGCTQGCLCLAFHTISAVYSRGFAGGRRPSLFAPSLCSTTPCKLHPFIRLKIRKKTKHHRSYEHGTPGVPLPHTFIREVSFTTPGEKICYQGNGYSKAPPEGGRREKCGRAPVSKIWHDLTTHGDRTLGYRPERLSKDPKFQPAFRQSRGKHTVPQVHARKVDPDYSRPSNSSSTFLAGWICGKRRCVVERARNLALVSRVSAVQIRSIYVNASTRQQTGASFFFIGVVRRPNDPRRCRRGTVLVIFSTAR